MTSDIRGVEGLRPRAPIGVVATVGHRGTSGAPVDKDRWFLMAPDAPAKAFGSRSMYAREPHGQFAAWNDAAEKGSERTKTLSGVVVHAEFERAVKLSRVAMKLPGMPNPPSRRPCCEGNGVVARRFVGIEDEMERFDEMPCPGRLCPYAQGDGPACKPTVHLLFMLEWPGGKGASKLPSMLCAWSSRSPRSIENLLGLFALVLGTRAVAPDSDPSTWEPGLAASLGIARPSLVGLPFTMTVGERTNAEKRTRYPTVRFSAGDLDAWLRSQADLRQLVGSPAVAALPVAPVDTFDAEFVRTVPDLLADVASPEEAEIVTVSGEPHAVEPRRLSEDQVFELIRECRDLGLDPDDLARDLGAKSLHLIPVPEGDAASGFPARLKAAARALSLRQSKK